ncbi:MAG: TolC family outer membrane protein [Burkholderiales bacterium]
MPFIRPVMALLFASVTGFACAADLLQVYREALVQDSEYAAARANWQANQEVVVQGRSLLLPNVGATGSYTFNNRDLRNIPNQQFNATFIGLNLSQPLFRMQNFVQYQQSRTQLTQSEAQFSLSSQDLILRVAQAYFDVLLAEVNLEVNEAQKRAIAQQLEQAKRNFEVGTATVVDTYEAQARYDLVVSQGIALQNDLAVKRDALERIIARPAPVLQRPPRGLQIDPPKPNSIDAWVSEAYETSLDVRLADAALTLARQQVELQRAGHYPTLDAVASVGYSDNSIGQIASQGFRGNITSAGVQLAIPIYQGGAIESRVRQAVAAQEKARQDLETARRVVAQSTRQAFLGLNSGIAQTEALRTAVVSTQAQVDSTKLGQEVGVRTEVDVLNAQQLLFSAQRDLAQAVFNTVINLFRLKAAVGQLTENDVVSVNDWINGRGR